MPLAAMNSRECIPDVGVIFARARNRPRSRIESASSSNDGMAVCDNPEDKFLVCDLFVLLWRGMLLALSADHLRSSRRCPTGRAAACGPPTPWFCSGGTIIDVTDWGRSALDQQDCHRHYSETASITDVGSRFAIPVPKGAQVIDCTGKFLVPGLDRRLYRDEQPGTSQRPSLHGRDHGRCQRRRSPRSHRFAANPSPHLYLLDSVGSTDNWSLLMGHRDWTAKLRRARVRSNSALRTRPARSATPHMLGTRVLWLGLEPDRGQYAMDHYARPSDRGW